MLTYKIGDIVSVSSTVDAGTGQTIEEYEWSLDGSILSSPGGLGQNVSISTVVMSEGIHTISLRVRNSCGAWSAIYSDNFELIAETCAVPIVSFVFI